MVLSSEKVAEGAGFRLFVGYLSIRHGDALPRFYLPVRMAHDRHGWECYPFPVALVLMPCIIIKSALMHIWFDLVNWLEIVELWNGVIRSKRG